MQKISKALWHNQHAKYGFLAVLSADAWHSTAAVIAQFKSVLPPLYRHTLIGCSPTSTRSHSGASVAQSWRRVLVIFGFVVLVWITSILSILAVVVVAVQVLEALDVVEVTVAAVAVVVVAVVVAVVVVALVVVSGGMCQWLMWRHRFRSRCRGCFAARWWGARRCRHRCRTIVGHSCQRHWQYVYHLVQHCRIQLTTSMPTRRINPAPSNLRAQLGRRLPYTTKLWSYHCHCYAAALHCQLSLNVSIYIPVDKDLFTCVANRTLSLPRLFFW